jgi:hypothetical protein
MADLLAFEVAAVEPLAREAALFPKSPVFLPIHLKPPRLIKIWSLSIRGMTPSERP